MTISTTEVVVDGVRSPVLQAGPPETAEAVVFVHGKPGPSDDWRNLVEQVGSFARAVAPDMPGYGRADKPRDFHYTIEGHADHLRWRARRAGHPATGSSWRLPSGWRRSSFPTCESRSAPERSSISLFGGRELPPERVVRRGHDA